ncbi:MAG: D-TA family PLP-dependent enzyme [Verrucomicrobia bacterium]|nr:D-TA family PLP-dependent enzyme [Verrucomicrobiota bacterium]
MNPDTWMRLANEADVPSPALVLHLGRIDENIRRMVARAGDPARLRPHIKTHKLPQLVARQIAAGITKFKCATIAEAELAATAGAAEVTLAVPPVGPNIARFVRLLAAFPRTAFSAIGDNGAAIAELGRAAAAAGQVAEVLLDLDIGQGRTGIAPGPAAFALYAEVSVMPGVRAGGLHAYDGHLHQPDFAAREAACDRGYAPVETMRAALVAAGVPVPRVVAGGSPTFWFHARRAGVECSPGTVVLWDASYAQCHPEMEFQPAATLLTRVVSRPGTNRLCLDLGHKAVASEMPHPRVIFPELPDARAVVHSEEHLVVETAEAGRFPVGTVLRGIPWHICPTVALHSEVFVAEGGRVTGTWPVVGRARRITI